MKQGRVGAINNMSIKLEIKPSELSVAKRLLLVFCGATKGARGSNTAGFDCSSVSDCGNCDLNQLRGHNHSMSDETAGEMVEDILRELQAKSNV